MDGTLVNLNVNWRELKKNLFEFVKKEKGEEVNFTPLDQKINQLRGKYGDFFYSQLLEIVSRFELCEERYELNHDLIDLLNKLKNKKIAIYSMNTRRCVENFIQKNLIKKPDIEIVKDDCTEPKPTGKDLKKILNIWKMNVEDVIYIGDLEKDRLSGEKANIKTYII